MIWLEQAVIELRAALDAVPATDKPEAEILTEAYLVRFLRRAPVSGRLKLFLWYLQRTSSCLARKANPRLQRGCVRVICLFLFIAETAPRRARKFRVKEARDTLLALAKFKCVRSASNQETHAPHFLACVACACGSPHLNSGDGRKPAAVPSIVPSNLRACHGPSGGLLRSALQE